MPWSLEIHHIDVGQGEATLILALRRNAGGGVIQRRAALIDGGLYGQGATVHGYLVAQHVAQLNVMVATHYDKDHYQGLRYLLNQAGAAANLYANTVIFDQGEQGNIDRFGLVMNRETDYIRYRNAITSRGARSHATANVSSKAFHPAGWQAPSWLVNQELLWRNNAGAAIAVPANAPTITCVAANQFVATNGGGNAFVFGGLSLDDRNRSSLAFLVEFNNLRYYTGGDLESTQEDRLGQFLNAGNNPAGAVHAMKASHHGSQYSTSNAFLNRLRPRAAFISCGATNSFNHPTQAVINRLHAKATIQNYYMTSCGFVRAHVPASSNLPQAGAKARVAGGTSALGVPWPGDVVLTATHAQATANPPHFDVSYWEEDTGANQVVNH
jgi:beta-lactamase superfamily II metal-dependent hydrolase